MRVHSITTLNYLVREAYAVYESMNRAINEGLPLTASLHAKFLCSCIFKIYPELRGTK